MQISTIGIYKFVREAEAIEFVLFSTPEKDKLHVNGYINKLMIRRSMQRKLAENS